MKKVLLIILGFLFLESCGINNLKHIEDINGEDNYSLNTLTEKDILSKNPHALFVKSLRTEKNKKIKFSCEKFSGVSDITSYNLEEDKEYIFIVNATINKGNGEIFIYKDGKKVASIDWRLNQEIKLENINGKIYFRIAGESANMNIEIEKVEE